MKLGSLKTMKMYKFQFHQYGTQSDILKVMKLKVNKCTFLLIGFLKWYYK